MTNLEHIVLLTLAILGVPAALAVCSIAMCEIGDRFGMFCGYELIVAAVTAVLLLLDAFCIAKLM